MGVFSRRTHGVQETLLEYQRLCPAFWPLLCSIIIYLLTFAELEVEWCDSDSDSDCTG